MRYKTPGGYGRVSSNISRYNYAKQANLKSNGKMKGSWYYDFRTYI